MERSAAGLPVGPPESSRAAFGPAAALSLLAIVIAAFACRAASVAFENSDPGYWDQNAYMILSLDMLDGERVGDGIRPPLYSAILTAVATPAFEFFTRAKLVSIAIGVAGVAAVFFIGRRHAGAGGALVAAVLVAVSEEYQIAAGHVACEVLLLPLLLAAWSAVWSALSGAESWRRAALAGVICGLTYVTKANWLILVPAFLGASLLVEGGPRSGLRRSIWFLAAFVVVASPFLAANWVEFGGPFSSPASRNYPWAESWSASAGLDFDELPTAATYVRDHTPGEAARRWVGGMLAMPARWFMALRPTGVALPSPLVGPAALAGMAALGVLALIVARTRLASRRAALLFSGLLFLGFNVAFGWFDPVGATVRYVSPWAGIVAVAFAAVARRTSLASRPWAAAVVVTFVLLGSVGMLIDAPALFGIRTLGASDRAACREGIERAVGIQRLSQPGTVIVYGTLPHFPYWMLWDRTQRVIPQRVDDAASFDAWSRAKGVDLLVLSSNDWEHGKLALGELWNHGDGGFAPSASAEARFRLLDPASYPCEVCVIAISERARRAVIRPR